MKRIHLILILAFAAVLLLWQGNRKHVNETDRHLKATQTPKSETLPPHQPEPSISKTKRPRETAAIDLDPKRFKSQIDEIRGLDPTAYDSVIKLQSYFKNLVTSSRATNQKIYEMIVASEFSEDEVHEFEMWFLSSAAASDPEWAINLFDPFVTANKMDPFTELGKKSLFGSQNWTPEYALAYGKWLDTAESTGRLEGKSREVAAARFDISLATGDVAGATQYFTQLTPAEQSSVIPEITKAATTPDERLRLIEQASRFAAASEFRELVKTVATQSGFEAARDILTRSKLNPEHHDLAAAATASANIGAETPARAAWLLESLKSNHKEAVTHFAAAWTEGDYSSAAGWLNSLPQGETRDGAIAGFAPAAARIDGASAVDWALTLSDTAQRDATLKVVSETWRKIDPAAADAYLKQKQNEPK